MKKLIPLLSILTLFAYGCTDRDKESGFEKQEQEVDQNQRPGFEKQRQEYRLDDANITTPIDSRPDLEEED